MGLISITAGTGPSAGAVARVTLSTAMPGTNLGIVLQAYDSGTGASVSSMYGAAVSSGLWTLNASPAITAGHSYVIQYLAFGL